MSSTGSGLAAVYCRLERAEANKVSNSSNLSVESDGLTPEQRLEPLNTRLINAGIATIHDMETLEPASPTRMLTRTGRIFCDASSGRLGLREDKE